MSYLTRRIFMSPQVRQNRSGHLWTAVMFIATFVFTSWLVDLPTLRAVGLGFQDALQQTSASRAARFVRVVNISRDEYKGTFKGRSPLDAAELVPRDNQGENPRQSG